MRIRVTCYGALREYLPPGSSGNSAPVELPESATVGDLLEALDVPSHVVFVMLVDDDTAETDRPLTEGVTVTLMPPFTGGAGRVVHE